MTRDELVGQVLDAAAGLDVAIRAAFAAGVPVGVILTTKKTPANPSGVPQVGVAAKGSDGEVRRWPP